MESATLRNLEQIQEVDAHHSAARIAALLLGSVGLGALVVVGVMSLKSAKAPSQTKNDALAQLVRGHRATSAKPAEELDGREVTFPGILSDEERPTTALAAVKDDRGRLAAQPEGPARSDGSLVALSTSDRLPVVPLPAGSLLSASQVTQNPQDPLTSMAAQASRVDEAAEPAPSGREGDFQIQVASFKSVEDADRFVEQLRKRGHKAYRLVAQVPNRGVWHRVRIGPFANKYDAENYRSRLERKERMGAFIVDPEKVKRAEQLRAGKLAARSQRVQASP
ncbi:MAG: SPOR domain-containing protein [Polyangiaceae bacterium]|nr:SPOR domain-containing protein [Polyangiaceae bacterium]